VNGEVAPAVAAGIEAVRDEALWRMAAVELVALIGSEDRRVRIKGLKIVYEASRIVRAELTVVLSILHPRSQGSRRTSAEAWMSWQERLSQIYRQALAKRSPRTFGKRAYEI
jgi:hypothetical protein